jgi:hypothetical protein
VLPEVAHERIASLRGRGVRVHVWLLASHGSAFHWAGHTGGHSPRSEQPPHARVPPWVLLQRGASVFAHCHWLSTHGLPKPVPVVRPYISPSVRQSCSRQPLGAEQRKSELVLLDNDNPPAIQLEVRRACEEIPRRCRVVLVEKRSREDVLSLLLEAKVVVDWCPVGHASWC